MKRFVPSFCSLPVAAIVVGAALSSLAAEVRVGLSARETYVGLPVTLRIQVADASKVDPPTIPSIDGVSVRSLGTPSHSTQITTINGSTTTSTTQTFAFELIPQRAGKFQIPAISIDADGVSQQTRAIEFVVSKSETGELMYVEIAGKEKQIYVGQSLDLTLKIWLRPYSDRRLKITLSEGDMWRLISDRSEWGPFAERIQQLAENNQRPVGKETLRKGGDGVEHSYYLYQIEATIYPKRPGMIDANNVKIVTNYPTALGRSRGLFADFFDDMPGGRSGPFGDGDGGSPFGAQLTVQTVRPLVAETTVEPINVVPIPTAGRPADYRGAVGQYQIAVEATPTHVKSGDPINLLIGISGTGPMELVQAPPLSELPGLTADFKVPNEPLAGFVKGDRKVFSTSIRPRKPGVTEIPAIPFSYFDPAGGKFVTVRSSPVSIQVEPAEMLALDTVVHGGSATDASSNTKQPAATGAAPISLSIFTGDDVLASQTPWTLNLQLLVTLLAIPPVAVFVLVLVRTRATVSIFSHRFGSAGGRLQRAVARATGPAEVAGVVKDFVVRECGLPRSTNDAEAVVGAIRESGHRNLAIRCERLFNRCANQTGTAAFVDENTFDDLKREALQWLQDWRAESLRQRPKPSAARSKPVKSPTLGPSTTTIVGAIVMAAALLVAGRSASAQSVDTFHEKSKGAATNVELNSQQQQSLLTEANNCYNAALDRVKSDSAEAKQGFADAADKYQLLVSAGATNSRLYFNLGNAYLESGQAGKAIANYLRCLQIDPTMHGAQENVAYAQKLLHGKSAAADVHAQDRSLLSYAAAGNGWLNGNVNTRTVFVIMVAAWFAMWTFVGLRIVGYRLPWKSLTSAAVVLFVLAGASSMLSWDASSRHLAVVIQPQAANALNPEVASATVSQGQVVELLQQRGGTVRIRTENGQTVWLPIDCVEVI